MITILNGNEKFLIESEIKKIINSANVDNINVVEYDGNDKSFNINDLVNDCLTLPFFSDKKVVILKNPKFFKAKKKTDDFEEDDATEQNYDALLKYCNKPVYETELIIYSYDFNFNKSLKIFKQITKNANVKYFNTLSPEEFKNTAYSIVKREKLDITQEAMNQLIVNSNGQLWLLYENIEKLKLFGEKIDIKVVDRLTDAYLEDKSYELTSAIFNRQTYKAIKIYRDLIANDINVFMLNATLANTIRMLHEVKYYLDQHYSDDRIADLCGLQRNRLYFVKKEINSYRNVNFLEMLSSLSELDQQLKSSSSLDATERFEILLINLMRED